MSEIKETKYFETKYLEIGLEVAREMDGAREKGSGVLVGPLNQKEFVLGVADKSPTSEKIRFLFLEFLDWCGVIDNKSHKFHKLAEAFSTARQYKVINGQGAVDVGNGVAVTVTKAEQKTAQENEDWANTAAVTALQNPESPDSPIRKGNAFAAMRDIQAKSEIVQKYIKQF